MGVEIVMQASKNYYQGNDVWDVRNYDWADVAISGAVGAIAPGMLAVGKQGWKTKNAVEELTKQLDTAKTVNRIQKIEGRISKNINDFKSVATTQAAWQGVKAVGKYVNGDGAAPKWQDTTNDGKAPRK